MGRTKRATKGKGSANQTGATVGYEAELWAMAGALRRSMDEAEYRGATLTQSIMN
ncbi:MAG TPA: hypothetical protein PLL76_20775 [Thermoanaerobaculia bacterium]|nr:hypothetical protein [Thermoanaerobaculia bacterium]